MKSLLLPILAVLSLSAPALAGDEISVVVNGRTYSCGEGGGPQYRYHCQCESRSWNVSLIYYRSNVQTGQQEFVKVINDGYGSAELCEKAIKEQALCRGGRH